MQILKGYFPADDQHQLYYELYGNPQGQNVVFLHGGPGLGFSDADRQFFDPDIHRVLFFAQRGAIRSQPLACLENNTTQHLIEDITQLMDHFEMEKAIFFGGSWGSALALLYAIEAPSRVQALVLRGVFTPSQQNQNHFENGGTGTFFPEAWNRYQSMVPQEYRSKVSTYYYEQILSAAPEIQDKFAYELVYYGYSLSRKEISAEEVENRLQHFDYLSYSKILSHYSVNHFFIPDDYIVQHLDKIGMIPVHIIHGRYDMICPPIIAHQVRQRLPHSKLYFVDAGHASTEPAILAQLKKSVLELSV